MVLLEFSMAPQGQGESLSAHVARILDVIDRSGVPYRLTPRGTILEGEWDQVIGVVGACFRELQRDCPRIGVNLKRAYPVVTDKCYDVHCRLPQRRSEVRFSDMPAMDLPGKIASRRV